MNIAWLTVSIYELSDRPSYICCSVVKLLCRCRLLLNGVVCTMQDKFVPAETFFEAAVTFEPQSILAWTMFGLCLN